MLRLASIIAVAVAGCSPAEPPLMIDPSDAPKTAAEVAPANGEDAAGQGASDT